MRKHYFSAGVVSALLMVMLTPATGFADPIAWNTLLRISSGEVEFDWSDLFAAWSVAGPGFTMTLVGGEPPAPNLTLKDGRVNPSFEGGVDVGLVTLRLGTEMIESGVNPPWTFTFRIDAPLVSPDFSDDNSFVVSFPFSLTALLMGSASEGAFHHNFAGSGHGSIFATTGGGANFGSLELDDDAAIPEPSTLLLAGIATLGALRRAKRVAPR